MAAQPASTVPSISPAEMQILISRSGLVLNPGQMADLVLAWRQVAGLIAAIPQGRKLADDMALTFRLSPPADAGGKPPTVRTPPPQAKTVAKPGRSIPKPARKTAAPKAAGKPASPAKAQAKAKRKAPARRPASRGR
ncbi:MAG TPA: hypothetical protein VMU81_03900 [Acetobacteraceae bacterium]|nr:hypothetical protein [Acetobacteraceae bacterium]